MRRREFIAGTAVTAALGLARPAYPQSNAPTPVTKRIAFVHVAEKVEDMTVNGRRSFKAYFGELNRLGYIEGRNLVVERYSARGRPDRYGDLARTVVASQPDLIVVSLTTAPDLVQNVARPENTKEWLEITRLKSSGVLNRCHSFPSETNTPQT